MTLAASGCDRRFSIGALRSDSVGSDEGGTPNDGGRADASGTGGNNAGCDGSGPLLSVGDGAGPACGDGTAPRAFRYVACSCDDLNSSTSVITDAFETARQTTELSEGSVGSNGAFYPVDAVIGGALTVAGSNGIPTRGPLTIGGDLRDQGQLDGQYDISVNGDAEVGGDLRVKSLSLAGTLTVNSSSVVDISEGSPPVTRSAVQVTPPCDCDTGPDIPALVLAARTRNDNAAVGLDPSEGLKALSAPLEITLPCGSYYVDELYAPNPITLTITGRVTLYINGDLVTEAGGALRVQLAPGAELDLVIANNLSTGDLVELGSAATPGRVRVYAGGTGSLSFAGNTTISGTLYAPKAELVTSAVFEVFGAVLARRMSASGALKLHYDRRLADGSCSP